MKTEQDYKQTILITKKNIINYYNDLGKLYEKEEKYMEAISECYSNIIKLNPNDYIVLNQIGICYFKQQNFKLAIQYFNKVIKIKESPIVYRNLGNSYLNSNDYKNAEKYYLLYSNFDKKCDETIKGMSKIYYYKGYYDKSIKHYLKVLLKNDDLYFNLSFCYLAKQNFKKGFELYENRLKFDSNLRLNIDNIDVNEIPYWNGIDHCESLIIIYEQGFGDNIQYYRFIIELSKKYPKMKIGYFCRNDIAYIFKEYENIKVISSVNIGDYKYKLYIMSLTKILNLQKIEPNKEDYILVNDEKNNYWKNKIYELSLNKKPRIGFAFKGLLNSFIEKYIPLIDFHNQFHDLDIDLICIHRKCDIEEDLKTLPNETNITHFDLPQDKTFEDIIAILKNIDLLITVDTYIAHLAGTLNIPTWLFVGISDWRWSTGTNKTYWYNSVELIRKQKQDDDFKDILKIVKPKLINYIYNYK